MTRRIHKSLTLLLVERLFAPPAVFSDEHADRHRVEELDQHRNVQDQRHAVRAVELAVATAIRGKASFLPSYTVIVK